MAIRAYFIRWWIRTTSLIQNHTIQNQIILAKSYVFYELPIRMNLYEWPTPNPAPKPTRHWGLDKSYKIVGYQTVSYEWATSLNMYEYVLMCHLVKYVRITVR